MTDTLKTKNFTYNLTHEDESYVRYDTERKNQRIIFNKKDWYIEVKVYAGIKMGSASHVFETDKSIKDFMPEVLGDCFDEVAFIEKYSEYYDDEAGVGLISGISI